ncbi:16S rRNA (cytosine(967)-C(5))-methyltransferase RsmB [bacterium]|nr:16S rRNA (cytosine(967)-C(5))-methyltransferase RsmB [bacterium]
MKQIDARHLAVNILDRVFRSNSYATIMLDAYFKKYTYSPEDRALTTELVYGTLRWMGWLNHMLQQTYHGKWVKVPPIIQRILEIGLYQILFLNRIPEYAAVHEAVKMAKEEKGPAWGRVVNGVLRQIVRHRQGLIPPSIEEDPVLAISVRWSHPEWLVERWIQELGIERTRSLCQANNERPKISVRINRLKTNRLEMVEHLGRAGFHAEVSNLLDEFITVDHGGGLTTLPSFSQGFFSIQDVSGGLVGRLMDPQPGETIIDLAAAPGGKTTHMAELGDDRLVIIAVDRYITRIWKIQKNQKRLNLKGIFPILGNGCQIGLKQADKVLVDAPCSGLGVIRRRGEIKLRFTPDKIPGLVHLQKSLLSAGAHFVKRGGILVYSTCTVLPEENDCIVNDFLKSHPRFQVEDGRPFVHSTVVSDRGFVETWTDYHGIDGSFAVRFKKIA